MSDWINFNISVSKDLGWKESDIHSLIMAFFERQGITVFVMSKVDDNQEEELFDNHP
jgi:hypothetical protein